MKPHMLFIGPLPEPTTGQSLACEVLLDSLHTRYDVTVVDLRKGSFRQGANSVARIVEIGRAIARVRRAQASADIIYLTVSESVAGNVKDLAFFAACGRKLGRMVIHLHGGTGMRELLGGKVTGLARINRFFLRKLAGVIVLGTRLTEIYSGTVQPERLAVVQNFAPSALFRTDEEIGRTFSDDTKLRILFLSNLLPGKGHSELLEAACRLAPSEQDRVMIDFAGGFEDGASREAFLTAIAGLPHVRYHGIVRGDRKSDLLARAHLFCLPTYYPYEGQPISILEAYASGTAVLTTDHAGIFDIFDPGKNGIQVEKGSSDSILAGLRWALSERPALYDMALLNAALARKHYREEHYIARMNEALSRLVPLAATGRAA